MTFGHTHDGQRTTRCRVASRLRELLALLVVLTVSIIAVPTPKPAEAALHNLFPADSFGFPQGRFEMDDALFVTLTSDIKGGVVCIVPASVTDPSSTDCVEPAWGEARTYVGMGTLLGFPLKAPPLKAGKWRLLATPIPTAPKGDLYNQFKERFGDKRPALKGYELSEPFEVVACTGPCDTSVATSQLAPWKARASAQKGKSKYESEKKAWELATYSKKIMDSYYSGMSMGLAGGLLSAGWTAMGFPSIPMSSEAIAKKIWKDLAGTTAEMWEGIKNDPPDPNFATVADPVFEPVDHVGDEVLDAYSDTLMRVAAYGTASRIANERYMGAVEASDHAAAEMQAQAASDFTSDLVIQLKRQQLIERLMATQAWAAAPIVHVPDGEADPQGYWNALIAQLETLTLADVTAADRQIMRDEGMTDAQIDEAIARWSDPEFVASAKSLDATETMADVLNASADELQDTITTYQSFDLWMSYNMVVEHDQIPAPPTNHPPLSKFSATKLTGTAPLTVTFTSQATDPDGDSLNLDWDIAGTRKASGASITHTFTTPGTYGVSLVATDPDGEWDQAIKWITVYPDSGTTPDPNRPPVAYFTPQLVDGEGPITQTFKSNSFDPDGDALTQTWYFGDGTTMTGATVTKTFPPGFIMSVLLVVSDGELTGQAAGEVTSRWPGGPPITNAPPVPSFTADPASGSSPLDVTFASTSTDPDGDALTQTWHFGDGDTATGATAVHTYTAAGTYTATLVVSDGTNSASTTRTVTVDAVSPIHAAIGISGGYDAAAAASGARMLDLGVPSWGGWGVANLTGPGGTPWLTAGGVNTDVPVIIRLAGDGRDLVDRIRLQGPTNTESAKHFSVELSSGTDPMSGYETVLDHEVLPNDATPHDFTFTPRTARYVRIIFHDNYAGTPSSRMSVAHLWMPTLSRNGGVVSYSDGNPATIVSAPPLYASYAASNLLRPDGEWRPARRQVTDQRVVVRLGAGTPLPISTFVLRAGGGSDNPKNFEIWGSDTGAAGTWTKLVDDQMNDSNGAQSFPVTGGPTPRFVELRFADNHGSRDWIKASEFRAVTEYGLNVADGVAVAAKVVDFSNEYNWANQVTNVLSSTPSGGQWMTSGFDNEFITVMLNEARLTSIDRVAFNAGGSRPRHVRVETSTDGVSFSTAAAVELADVGSVEQTISFAPTQARFVRVVFVDSYGGGNLVIGRLRIYDTASGGAQNVPFVDRSSGTAPATAWHWDFGDGTTSTEQHPVHTFPGTGTYTVTLTVTDEGGNTDTATTTYTVAQTPVLSLTTSAAEQPDGTAVTDEGVNVTLTASDSLHSAAAWDWDLGYTTLSGTGATVTAKFPNEGTYVVRYRALGATGVYSPWATKTFVVRNVAPVVRHNQTAVTVLAGDTRLYGVASITDVDPVRCTWDWGDGTAPQTISGGNFGCTWAPASVSHTYAEVGNYTAKLIVDDGVDTTVGTVAVTVNHRPTVLQVVDATEAGADLAVTGRLLDSTSGAAVGGVPASIGADGSAPVASTTDPDGFIHVTLPGAADANVLHLVSAETSVYTSASLERLVDAPKLDLVFVIDDSESMSPYRQAVRDNLWKIAQALGRTFDYRIGVVGYANQAAIWATPSTPLTDDFVAIRRGINNPVPNGGHGSGAQTYDALVVASGFRYDNGTASIIQDNRIGHVDGRRSCAVLVSDAGPGEAQGMIDSNDPQYPWTDYAAALEALQTRDTTLFSVIGFPYARLAFGTATDDQGGAGLALMTGGDDFSIGALMSNADEVLGGITTKCGRKAGAPDLSVAVTGPSGVQSPGSTVTWTVTGANEGKVSLDGVTTSLELPADVSFTSATDGGVYDPATRKVTWAEGTMAAGATTSHTVTVEVDAADWDAGDHVRTATASIVDDGTHGPEINEDNNVATHAVTVHVERDIPPTTTSTSTTSTSTTSTSTTSTSTTSTTTTVAPTTTTTTTTLPSTTTSTSTTSTTTTTSTSTTTLPPTTTSTTTTTLPSTTTVPVQVGPTDTGHVPSGPLAPSLPSAAPLPPGSAVGPTSQVAPEGELPRTGPPVPATGAGLLGSFLAMLGALLVVLGRRRRPHRTS